MTELDSKNLSANVKGIIALVGGVILLLQSLNIIQPIHTSLTVILLFIAIFLLVYGALKLNFFKLHVDKFFGKKSH